MDPARTHALKVGNRVLLAHGSTMRLVRPIPVLSPLHAMLHRVLAPAHNPRSFLHPFIRHPNWIFMLGGLKKHSLFLYFAFTKQERIATDMDIWESLSAHLSGDQLVLLHILLGNPQEWRDLLLYDPHTFVELSRYLNMGMEGEVASSDERTLLDIAREVSSRRLSARAAWSTASERLTRRETAPDYARIHGEFCKCPRAADGLAEFSREYAEMVASIRNNALRDVLYTPRMFFNEIRMYNELVLAKSDPRMMDRGLLLLEAGSENERLVYDYYKRACDL